jgi:hypothetical protein
VASALNDIAEDSKVLLHSVRIGSYTLASGQTISFKINSAVPSAPSGYTRYTYVYASLQNYCQTSVNFVENDIYATMTNHFTKTLTYDLYAYVLFFRYKMI